MDTVERERSDLAIERRPVVMDTVEGSDLVIECKPVVTDTVEREVT